MTEREIHRDAAGSTVVYFETEQERADRIEGEAAGAAEEVRLSPGQRKTLALAHRRLLHRR
jgi:hypothetical protein